MGIGNGKNRRTKSSVNGRARKKLANIAATITRFEDYGYLFWHEERGHVFWTNDDSASSEWGATEPWEIEKKFSALPEVNIVEADAEMIPGDANNELSPQNGWERIKYQAKLLPEDIQDQLSDEERNSAYRKNLEKSKAWENSEQEKRVEYRCEDSPQYLGGIAWVRPGHEQNLQVWVEQAKSVMQQENNK